MGSSAPGDPAAGSLQPPLAALPEALRGLLTAAGVGKLHLMRAGRLAQALDDRVWPGLAGRLFLAAWEYDPLDGALASLVLSLGAPGVSAELAALLGAVARAHRAPADLKYYARLAARRDHDKLRHYLTQQRLREPGNLFWLSREFALLLCLRDHGGARDLAGQGLPDNLAALSAKLLGDLALLDGDAGTALADYRDFQNLYNGPGTGFARARALTLSGRTGRAREVLAALAADHPWCVNACLALHDFNDGPSALSGGLSGGGRSGAWAKPLKRVAILLYTFNKAGELRLTLDSLAAGLTLMAGQSAPLPRIVVLDNGSTDATQEVLDAACDRLGPDGLRVIRLPVNIGAPAARNWLMREPEALQADHVVYLDDDVELPGDWLARFGAAVAAYPGAGVYGCKVVDQAQPMRIQSADLHLEALADQGDGQNDPDGLGGQSGLDGPGDLSGTGDPGEPGGPPTTRRFDISSAHHQVLDCGQFDYLRPCASVTGCLHLFNAQTLRDVGDFDLRFSPSQFDDLDHDLRLLAIGKIPVYQGRLRLPHLKRTGADSGTGQTGYGLGFANQYKLHGKYSRDELAGMAAAAARAVWRDYLDKWTALHDRSSIT